MSDARQQALDAFMDQQNAPAPDAAPDPRRQALDAFMAQRRDGMHAQDVANTTERELNDRIQFTPPDSGTTVGWVNRASRAATFGLSDTITAFAVQHQMKDEVPDLSYAEALSAVRDGFKADQSLTAEIVGSLVPGVAVGRGLTKAWDAATRAGLTQGALRFVANNPKSGRVIAAMGAGAAGGMVEEFVRTSVDETVGIAAAEDFDGGRIMTASLTGAVLGGVVGAGIQLLARGAGPVPGAVDIVQRFGAAFNVGPQQAQTAGTRIWNAMRLPDETAEQTMARVAQDAQIFQTENGYAPAMADLMAPEKVAEVADLVRYYSGLDTLSAKYADDGLERAMSSFRRAIDSGDRLKSTEQIESQAEDMFTEMARRYGSTPVAVSDDVMDQLAPVAGWVKGQNMNAGGKAIARVLDAKANIDVVRQRTGNLRNARNVADARAEMGALGDEIAFLQGDPAGVGAARDEVADLAGGDGALGAMKNLYAQLRAQTDNMKASDGAVVAQQKLDRMQASLGTMETALDDYRAGLTISLSDANSLRAAASKWTFKATDLAQQEQARAVRDAMSGVGVTEVPRYGQMVRLFRDGMTRSDAQQTGIDAAKGTIDLRDLGTRLRKARLTNRPRSQGTAVDALRRGVREGAVRQISNEAQGTTAQALSTSRRLTDSPRVQQGLDMAAPRDSRRITDGARRANESADQMGAMARPASPSITSEELAQMRELATGAVFGNLGGAGRAALVSRVLQGTRMSRGAARKTIDMLGDPQQFDQAVRYMESKGADVGAFFGAMVAATAGKASEE